MIKLENVSKSYGKNTVLDNLSLVINDGERVFIRGASGTGKTTLLRVISGLESSDGSVFVDKKIAYMFQESRLFDHLSALENVLCVCENVTDKEKGKALELLSRLGLGEDANTVAGELSGGMAQRVALARTLMANRDIILLDEPFSALDPKTRMLAADLINDYCKEDKTLLLVSHIEADMDLLCKREIKLQPS